MALSEYEAVSEEEYFRIEERTEYKNEYVRGRIIPMLGASWNHALTASRTAFTLSTQLTERDYLVLSARMRMKVLATGNYFYPDVLVIAGPPALVDGRDDIISNPVLLVEIDAPERTLLNRDYKLSDYIRIPSLAEYLIISPDAPRVERFLRQASGDWLYSEVRGLDGVLDLPSIGCKLALAEVYRKVRFGAADASDTGDEMAAPEGED